MELTVNLANGDTASLRIIQEENFENDVIGFCQKHDLDDDKRKKLMKLVKVQLIEMYENGELGINEEDNGEIN